MTQKYFEHICHGCGNTYTVCLGCHLHLEEEERERLVEMHRIADPLIAGGLDYQKRLLKYHLARLARETAEAEHELGIISKARLQKFKKPIKPKKT